MKYETFVRILRIEKETQSLTSLASMLHMKETEMALRTEISKEALVFKIRNLLRGRQKPSCGAKSSNYFQTQARREPSSHRSNNRNVEERREHRFDQQCHQCGKPGHIAREWVIESGASRYFTGEQEFFLSIKDPSHRQFVATANGWMHTVKGQGDVQFSGHACFHTLSLINSEGLPKFKTEGIQCQQCLQGRQTRNSISKESTTRSSKRLDLTHINLCGPLSVASLSGTRYFILLVDD
uniref:CCHC-type domain-containing protein n=1 Tax=Physcomitrium patens TaxID=3218 RepID=A0A2K1KE59_PHYPA|nr:hypothetical protein PHYPA_008439 [Physcomitrium patens]